MGESVVSESLINLLCSTLAHLRHRIVSLSNRRRDHLTVQTAPLNAAPLGREGYSRPTVAAIGEDEAGESSAAANLPVGALQQLMQGE